MDPAPGGLADPAGDDVDEGGHVVVGDPLPGLDLGHVGGGDHAGGALLDGGHMLGRDRAEQRPGLRGQDLDLQPGGESGLVAPQRCHLRQRIPGDHGATPAATAAMSRRNCIPGQEIRPAAS